jgi:hypothetical protein
MTNGQTRFSFRISFDDYEIAEIKTKDYREGIKKARRLCEEKFG